MLEQSLITHSSPTLARLKTASLFCFPYHSNAELQAELARCRRILTGKGVSIRILRRRAGRALLYVYRSEDLRRDLQLPGVAEFLRRQGYPSTEPGAALRFLGRRLRIQEEFPHEIGLFLGYPLGDVVGFIENQGRNCKCVGCWKVYCDECEAQKRFAQFKKCQDIYTCQFRQGWTLEQLTVGSALPS